MHGSAVFGPKNNSCNGWNFKLLKRHFKVGNDFISERAKFDVRFFEKSFGRETNEAPFLFLVKSGVFNFEHSKHGHEYRNIAGLGAFLDGLPALITKRYKNAVGHRKKCALLNKRFDGFELGCGNFLVPFFAVNQLLNGKASLVSFAALFSEHFEIVFVETYANTVPIFCVGSPLAEKVSLF